MTILNQKSSTTKSMEILYQLGHLLGSSDCICCFKNSLFQPQELELKSFVYNFEKTMNVNQRKLKLKLIGLKKPTKAEKESHTPETDSSFTKKVESSTETLKTYECINKLKEVNINTSYDSFYELKEKIGEGVHSVVYKCVEKSTNQLKAIKLSKRKDPELIHEMTGCYQIMREVSHPNIIRGEYLFLDEPKLTCQMVMELCTYPQLQEFINEKKQKKQVIPEEIIAKILSSLLNCIAYLHDMGVCHRDIKPENILYNPSTGDLKLLDFETARIQRYENEKLDLWSNTGTLLYRAPESFRGGYSEEIDIWSVGVTAFLLFTGRLPFYSEYEKEAIKKIRQESIDFDSLEISSSSKFLLRRLLEKNPKTRITAKDALSSHFFLKNLPLDTLTMPSSQLNSSFSDYEDHDESDESQNEACKFYDEDSHYRLADILSQDIGIRRRAPTF